jgi:hypothetical protein
VFTPSEVKIESEPSKIGFESQTVPSRETTGRSKTFAEAFTSDVLYTDAAVLKVVSEISRKREQNRASVYQKTAESKVPRFYINTQANAISLVANTDGSVDENDPYNTVVAAFTGLQPNVKTGLFEVPSSAFVSEATKTSATKFANYCHKVRRCELELNEASSDERNLLTNINRFVANRAWLYIAKIDNLLSPPSSEKEIKDQLGRLHGKARTPGSSHLDVTYRRKLLRETEKWFTPDFIAYGHALVYGLSVVADLSIGANDKIWRKLLAEYKFLRPSVKDLERVGVFPSIGLKDYKNLFTPLEWGEIESSGLLKIEERSRNLRQRKLDFESILQTLVESTKIKSILKEDQFYENFIAIKEERLLLCGTWKKEQKKDVPLRMWRKVGEHFSDSSRTREAFGVGRIAILTKKLIGVTYQALNNLVAYESESDTFVVRNEKSLDNLGDTAKSCITEFLGLISS